MGNGIEAVKNTTQNQQPSTLKRIAVTLSPVMAAGGIFAKALAEGKSMSDAGKEVKNDFNSVHDANKKDFKNNVGKAADKIYEHPVLSFFGLGALSSGICLLDKAIN